MSDQIKFRKMLEILLLLSGNFGYSINEIADKFETTPRTIYRYLDTFKAVGFKVIKQNGYSRIDKINSSFRDLSELIHFSKEEAIILSKAIHLISDENKFKSDLYEKLYYLFDKDSVANQLIPKENSDNALKLKKAITNKQQVILKKYSSSNSRTYKDRLVEPFEFTSIYDSFWAYDIEDNQCKIFKIARIGEVLFNGKTQEFKSNHKEKKIDVFRFSGDKEIEISFTMSRIAYNLLIEEYPISDEFVKEINDDTYIFNGWVSNFIGVGRFILGLMDEINLIEPEKLREFLNAKVSNKNFS